MSANAFINQFNRLIRGLDLLDGETLRHRERSSILALLACRNNNRAASNLALESYVNRQITEDTDWIFDDFLLFSFICHLVKFGEYKEVIKQIVTHRRRTEHGERLKFIQDVEHFAETKEFSVQSMFSVVIADVLEKAIESPKNLIAAHREAVQVLHDNRISSFERAIAIRCKEVIAELSINSSMSSSILTRNLWRRNRFAAMIVYLTLSILVTCLVGWVIWLTFKGGNDSSSWPGKVISVGALGLVVYMWKSRSNWYNRIAYSLVWIVSGTSGFRAMMALNNQYREQKGRMELHSQQ